MPVTGAPGKRERRWGPEPDAGNPAPKPAFLELCGGQAGREFEKSIPWVFFRGDTICDSAARAGGLPAAPESLCMHTRTHAHAHASPEARSFSAARGFLKARQIECMKVTKTAWLS